MSLVFSGDAFEISFPILDTRNLKYCKVSKFEALILFCKRSFSLEELKLIVISCGHLIWT